MHFQQRYNAQARSAFFGDGTVPDDADMFDPRHIPADLPRTASGKIQKFKLKEVAEAFGDGK